MANNTLLTKLKLRADSQDNWQLGTRQNYVPLMGEPIVYKNAYNPLSMTYDLTRMKIGSGSHSVANLPFIDEPYYKLIAGSGNISGQLNVFFGSSGEHLRLWAAQSWYSNPSLYSYGDIKVSSDRFSIIFSKRDINGDPITEKSLYIEGNNDNWSDFLWLRKNSEISQVYHQRMTLTVPVTQGGTGASTAALARTNLGITLENLGAAAAVHTHAEYVSDINFTATQLSFVKNGATTLRAFPKAGYNILGMVESTNNVANVDTDSNYSMAPVKNGKVYYQLGAAANHTHSYAGSASVGGPATSALKLNTARTIALTGDTTGSVSFNGGANVSIATTLAASGVSAGTYSKVTVDSKGRVTAGSSIAATDVPNLNMSKITTGSLLTSRLVEPDYMLSNVSRTAVSLFDITRADRLYFLPPSQVIIEQSIDAGITWTDAGVSDSSKAGLFTGLRPSINVPHINGKRNTNCMLRVTITGMRYDVPAGTPETEKYQYWNSNYVLSNERYCTLQDAWLWVNSVNDRIYCKVEKATGAASNNWISIREAFMSGWSGGNYIKLDNANFGGGTGQTTNNWNWRFTFRTATTALDFDNSKLLTGYETQHQRIMNIKVTGLNVWSYSNNMMYHDHLYKWDNSQNATFPAGITATGFTGPLTGTASLATKLATARTIGLSGVTATAQSFDGSLNISIPITAVPTSLLTGVASANNLPEASGTAAGIITAAAQTIAGVKTFSSTITGSVSGNSGTATVLATARTLTIGSKGKTFNGSANVAWSLAEIGAAASAHTHGITDLSGVAATSHTHGIADLSGAAPTSHASTATTYGVSSATKYGHSMASSATPLVAGTAAVGTDNGKFAREGHVHPLQTTVTGNAGTATILQTARTLTLGNTGKTFNGSANVAWSLTEIGAAAAEHTHSSSDLIDVLPITGGGTGASDAASARSALGITLAGLGAAAATHTHTASQITDSISIAKGGTGATTAATARSNLGITLANLGAAATVHTHTQAQITGLSTIISNMITYVVI